jgi:hypothetical protein
MFEQLIACLYERVINKRILPTGHKMALRKRGAVKKNLFKDYKVHRKLAITKSGYLYRTKKN